VIAWRRTKALPITPLSLTKLKQPPSRVRVCSHTFLPPLHLSIAFCFYQRPIRSFDTPPYSYLHLSPLRPRLYTQKGNPLRHLSTTKTPSPQPLYRKGCFPSSTNTGLLMKISPPPPIRVRPATPKYDDLSRQKRHEKKPRGSKYPPGCPP